MQLWILASSVTEALDQPYVSLMYVLHVALRMHIREVGTPYSVWKGFSTSDLPSPLSVCPEGMVQAVNKRYVTYHESEWLHFYILHSHKTVCLRVYSILDSNLLKQGIRINRYHKPSMACAMGHLPGSFTHETKNLPVGSEIGASTIQGYKPHH